MMSAEAERPVNDIRSSVPHTGRGSAARDRRSSLKITKTNDSASSPPAEPTIAFLWVASRPLEPEAVGWGTGVVEGTEAGGGAFRSGTGTAPVLPTLTSVPV